MRRILYPLPFLASTAALLGCGAAAPPAEDGPIASVPEPVLGNLGFASDCSEGERFFLNDTAMYGRIAAASGAPLC